MNNFYLIVVALFFTTMNSISQEKPEDFKPHGKPLMKIYSNYHSTFTEGGTQKAFELTRVYLGYQYAFSKNFSGGVVFDVGDPESGNHQLAAFVKNAELEYDCGNLNVHFGLITTTQFKIQENFWGYRYLLKSFQDEYGFASSADLGVSISYRFTNWLDADFAVYNGEGYKKLQADNIFRNAAGITILPVKGFILRGLFDWMGNDAAQQSWVGFAGYSAKKYSIGAEYNYQKNQDMKAGHDWYGPSFYAQYEASEKIIFFARFDQLSSKKTDGAVNAWNFSRDGKLFVVGMEYAPLRGINLAPNFQGWTPADGDLPTRSSVFLNCEIYF
ncbi:MAG: hypothetical protein RBS73_05475 [Prolixibacteraceae bacterium]|jgi:hypothetical protein|nr:hypothetical protein [Prolixibacteraceae bacterium]